MHCTIWHLEAFSLASGIAWRFSWPSPNYTFCNSMIQSPSLVIKIVQCIVSPWLFPKINCALRSSCHQFFTSTSGTAQCTVPRDIQSPLLVEIAQSISLDALITAWSCCEVIFVRANVCLPWVSFFSHRYHIVKHFSPTIIVRWHQRDFLQ